MCGFEYVYSPAHRFTRRTEEYYSISFRICQGFFAISLKFTPRTAPLEGRGGDSLLKIRNPFPLRTTESEGVRRGCRVCACTLKERVRLPSELIWEREYPPRDKWQPWERCSERRCAQRSSILDCMLQYSIKNLFYV